MNCLGDRGKPEVAVENERTPVGNSRTSFPLPENFRACICSKSSNDETPEVIDVLAYPNNAYHDLGKRGAKVTYDMKVEVAREGPQWRNLGLLVSPSDDQWSLTIDDIDDYSLIAEWNAQQADDAARVKRGDVIVFVDVEERCANTEILSRLQSVSKGATVMLGIKRSRGPTIGFK
mmetsp:Transcript_48581/g.75645  ORF Transcript_48581/g.75645 Transcript_48581/m.75645 type:complete len:176 (-) Transcript_48581:15-542(-)